MMEIYIRKQLTIKKKNNYSNKNKYGVYLFKSYMDLKVFINLIFYIEILKFFYNHIQSANVFLNKDGIAKLGDLNVSKVAKNGLLYTQTGTPYYASP